MEALTPIQSYLDLNIKSRPSVQDQHYFGHGKLLLTGEYAIMDGASALALPTKAGQSLSVKYQQSFDPKLSWRSYDTNGNVWFDAQFEFWHFELKNSNLPEQAVYLQELLRLARKQNTHFLRDEVDVIVETHLGFPLEWGLGSSSTLIYNIAQWAYISPFKLAFDHSDCSGYDIACAQSDGPIVYRKDENGPHWETVKFSPSFIDQIYLVYLGNKQNTLEAVANYRKTVKSDPELIRAIGQITQDMLQVKLLKDFDLLLDEHERLLSMLLKKPTLKSVHFQDYWGSMKSLGAWGGDFMLVTSGLGEEVTRRYFKGKGHDIVFRMEELMLNRSNQERVIYH